MKYSIVWLFVLVVAYPSLGQDEGEYYDSVFVQDEDYESVEEWDDKYFMQYDSSAVEVRSLDPERIEQMKNDPELSYGYTKGGISLWTAFWIWLGSLLDDMFDGSAGSGIDWLEAFYYLMAITILVYVIFKLLKIEDLRMFYRAKPTNAVDQGIIVENIHELDFNQLINEALRENNYRVAIRMSFLYGLKLLSDCNQIVWEPGKTNHDYVREIKSGELRGHLSRLNYYFEYAWYGDFRIDKLHYTKANEIFTSIKNQTLR